MRKALFILISWILFSCHRTPDSLPPGLRQAEMLIQTYPDCALALLDSLAISVASDDRLYATWCLLQTQAQDRKGMPQTSDSLIHIAFSYFKNNPDVYRKAMALYYKGKVKNGLHHSEEAIAYYQQAANALKEKKGEKEDRLLQQIYFNLGAVYEDQKMNDLSLSAYEKSYTYACQIQDSACLSVSLVRMGKIASRLARWDSAVFHYSQAIQVSQQIRDLKTECLASTEISLAYYKLKQYTWAIQSLKRAEHRYQHQEIEGIDRTYLCLGRVYMKMEKYDSATIYFNKALKTNDISRIKSTYQCLYQLNEKQKKFREAVAYNNLYSEYTDSLTKISQARDISEIIAKYNPGKYLSEQKKLKQEKEKLENGVLYLLVCIICLIVSVVYFFQRRVFKKERAIQQMKSQIELYKLQISYNETIIQQNVRVLQSISRQLEENDDLKERATEQQNRISDIYHNNESLQKQNRYLAEELKHYSLIVGNTDKTTLVYQELKEQNNLLKNREKTLSEYMLQQLDLFKRLKEAPHYIEAQDWPSIQEAVNIVYNNFAQRLQDEFPALTDTDLHICCLIKLKFTTSLIAALTRVSPPSITKRKQRIKERMSQSKPEIWTVMATLEQYFSEY